MKQLQRPVFTSSHHDPNGKYNNLFKKALPEMQKIFSKICIGVTPETASRNKKFIEELKKNGCVTFINKARTSIGDHYRSALQLAVNESKNTPIYFGFIDRTIYALNSSYLSQFKKDILRTPKNLILFERTAKAWKTHPRNYFTAENTANEFGRLLTGKYLELATCGFLITPKLAKKILPLSIANSFSAGTEWIMQALMLREKPIIIKCDWLSWEDPIIENIPAKKLKKKREQDKQEVIKRLEMNIQIAQVLIEPRFYPLIKKK
jgi:GR25 family glycosyltransferase involved in LPS biosynthesis